MLNAVFSFLGGMPVSSGLVIVAGLALYVISELRRRRVHKD